MLKQCSFSTHWNYVEPNLLKRHKFFNYLKLIIEKMLNDVGFLPTKITSKQVHQNDFNFSSIAITSKSTSKWHGSFSIFSFRCMDVKYRPWFNVVCPLGCIPCCIKLHRKIWTILTLDIFFFIVLQYYLS